MLYTYGHREIIWLSQRYFGQGEPVPTSTSTSEGASRKRLAEADTLAGPSKHTKSGVDQAWFDDFPWLETTLDDHGETGMWYTVCRTSNCRPKRIPLGKAAWIEIP